MDCLAGALLIAAVASCDWWTGPDLPLALCYLVPTTLVAWRVGLTAGIVTGVVCTLAWAGIELVWERHFTHPAAPYTNALLQLAVTLFAAWITAAVAERSRRLRSEIVVRRAAENRLAALNESLESRVAERSAAAENRAAELAASAKTLRHQGAMLRSILTSMRDGVIVADDDGTIRLFNPAAAQLLGFPIDSGKPGKWLDQPALRLDRLLQRFEIDPSLMNAVVLAVDSPGGFEFRIPGVEPDTTQWIGVTGCRLVDEPDAPSGTVYVFTDITSRRHVDLLVADAAERERRRIGQDLHDGLGQHLVGTSIAVSLLKDRLAGRSQPEAADAAVVAELLQSALTESRNLARGLYPVKLEEEGLSAALAELTAHTARTTDIPCGFRSDVSDCEPDPSLRSHLFRIAQEALNNAVKHGEPRRIMVRLHREETLLLLQVLNDGRPFPADPVPTGGMGLDIMRYRARIIGGELRIGPGPEGGTLVVCSVPLNGRNPP